MRRENIERSVALGNHSGGLVPSSFRSPAGSHVGSGDVGSLLTRIKVRRIEGKEIPFEACGFDSESYVNPEPSQQALVREILHDFGWWS